MYRKFIRVTGEESRGNTHQRFRLWEDETFGAAGPTEEEIEEIMAEDDSVQFDYVHYVPFGHEYDAGRHMQLWKMKMQEHKVRRLIAEGF